MPTPSLTIDAFLENTQRRAKYANLVFPSLGGVDALCTIDHRTTAREISLDAGTSHDEADVYIRAEDLAQATVREDGVLTGLKVRLYTEIAYLWADEDIDAFEVPLDEDGVEMNDYRIVEAEVTWLKLVALTAVELAAQQPCTGVQV